MIAALDTSSDWAVALGILVFVGFVAFLFLLGWAVCAAGSNADEQSEREWRKGQAALRRTVQR